MIPGQTCAPAKPEKSRGVSSNCRKEEDPPLLVVPNCKFRRAISHMTSLDPSTPACVHAAPYPSPCSCPAELITSDYGGPKRIRQIALLECHDSSSPRVKDVTPRKRHLPGSGAKKRASCETSVWMPGWFLRCARSIACF